MDTAKRTDDRVMIEVDQLYKNYGGRRAAVDRISFQVRSGEVLGFLGPNGAGKTTTMKMLTSFLAPTDGRAAIAGYDVYAESVEVRRRVGYLPEDTPLYKDMTVLEYLEYVCDIRGIARGDRRRRIKRTIEQVGLGDRAGNLIGELSKGYRQRVGLAQAIIHEPAVLILDEPTSGLDPNQIVEIRSVIKTIGESKTVIFSTHILSEVQATCSRVIIIADGKIAADGTPDELSRSASGVGSILLEVGGSRGGGNAPKDLLAYVDGIASVDFVPQGGTGGSLYRVFPKAGVDPRGDIAKVIATANDMELLQLTPEKASLEEVFRKLTRTAPPIAEKAS